MVLEPGYRECIIRVTPGDVLLLQTDGLIEAQNQRREFYGEERVRNVLKSLATGSMRSCQIRDAILEDVRRFVGSAQQQDDMTVVVVKFV
jgi:sigma-B regulation protein RsbU (phosphoserine phosphatase)